MPYCMAGAIKKTSFSLEHNTLCIYIYIHVHIHIYMHKLTHTHNHRLSTSSNSGNTYATGGHSHFDEGGRAAGS